MKDGFIISAIDKNNKQIYFISNTSPILWTSNIEESKVFPSYNNAKNDLEDDFITLSATICNTNIASIIISKYINNIEIRRNKFI